MRFMRLSRDEKGHAALFEEVCRRVMSFSHRLQGSGQGLVEEMWRGFAARDPGRAVWAALREDETLVGHSVAAMILWGHEWVGWSYQTEMDERATREVHDGFLRAMEEWAMEWNRQVASARPDMAVRELMMFTPNDPKAMERHTGFTFAGTILRRPLPRGGS